jgi:7-cyano-7-deazaguanine synthase
VIDRHLVHLLSGGLDSVTMLYDLRANGCRVHALLVDYGQPHLKELEMARFHADRLSVIHSTVKLPNLGGLTEGDWIVPNRNMILLSLAINRAVIAGADTVTIGCNADDADAFPDCRAYFIANMKVATRGAGLKVEVCAPYLDMEKHQILKKSKTLGIDLSKIWTCYKGGTEPCRDCPACVKLTKAVYDADAFKS